MLEAIASWGGDDNLHWSQNSKVTGYIYFYQPCAQSEVCVEIELTGLEPGFHGCHVHELPLTKQFLKTKDCCSKLLGHFNPYNTYHGSKEVGYRHVGDLCNNVVADENGNVHLLYTDDLISLIPEHPANIVGRSIVLHENEDDGGRFRMYEYPCGEKAIKNRKKRNRKMQESITTGNAGIRVACANIFYI